MVGWFKLLSLALLPGGLLFVPGPAPHAATSSMVDILPNDAAADVRDTLGIGGVKPIANRERSKPLLNGNPLWSVPLSGLTATRERPIFSPSRRQAQRALVASTPDQPVASVPVAPERPPLALIGAVIGESDAIAVFLDLTNQGIVRLRLGEARAGWILSSIRPREVTLKRGDQTESIVLQRTQATPASPSSLPPASATPVSGGTDASYTPFIPRSTPKNGESDGL